MKNGQIFAHKSTARGRLDLEYLDERSNRKVSLRERASIEQQIGRKTCRIASSLLEIVARYCGSLPARSAQLD
jgi:hypothetical protein